MTLQDFYELLDTEDMSYMLKRSERLREHLRSFIREEAQDNTDGIHALIREAIRNSRESR